MKHVALDDGRCRSMCMLKWYMIHAFNGKCYATYCTCLAIHMLQVERETPLP